MDTLFAFVSWLLQRALEKHSSMGRSLLHMVPFTLDLDMVVEPVAPMDSPFSYFLLWQYSLHSLQLCMGTALNALTSIRMFILIS